MKTPHGLWLDNRRPQRFNEAVADRANARLQYFTLDGKHIKMVEGLLFPASFDIRGNVLLVPDTPALRSWTSTISRSSIRLTPIGLKRGEEVRHPRQRKTLEADFS